jgi:hypothetical protein
MAYSSALNASLPFPNTRPFPSHLGPRFQAISDPAVFNSLLELSV